MLRSESLQRFKSLMFVGVIFSTADPFISKFGIVIVIHPHEPECHEKRLLYF